MKRKARRLQDIRDEVVELEAELAILLEETGSTLVSASGIGTIIAAEIVGEVGDIHRFHSPAALAMHLAT